MCVSPKRRLVKEKKKENSSKWKGFSFVTTTCVGSGCKYTREFTHTIVCKRRKRERDLIKREKREEIFFNEKGIFSSPPHSPTPSSLHPLSIAARFISHTIFFDMEFCLLRWYRNGREKEKNIMWVKRASKQASKKKIENHALSAIKNKLLKRKGEQEWRHEKFMRNFLTDESSHACHWLDYILLYDLHQMISLSQIYIYTHTQKESDDDENSIALCIKIQLCIFNEIVFLPWI